MKNIAACFGALVPLTLVLLAVGGFGCGSDNTDLAGAADGGDDSVASDGGAADDDAEAPTGDARTGVDGGVAMPASDAGVAVGGHGDASAGDSSLYAINVRVFAGDFSNQTSYVALVDDLDRGEASLDDAIELPGSGSLWGEPGAGQLFFVSAENLSVTKYVLRESGRLEQEGAEIGLSGAGVTSLIGEAMAFAGGNRGFLFDMVSQQAIEINLAEMRVEAIHGLSALAIESAALTYLGDGGFKPRGDELVGVVYGSNVMFDEVASQSKVGFFDPDDGSLEVLEPPCGGLQYSFESENGDWYFSTDPWVAGIHALDDSRSPAPCLVRLPSGTRTFAEPIALNELTGGITGGIIPGAGHTAFVRVLDEAQFPLQDDTGFLDPFSTSAWNTWRVDLLDLSATQLDRAAIAGGIKYADVQGRVYQNESETNFSSTTLVRSTEDGDLADALVVPGVPWNVVKVR